MKSMLANAEIVRRFLETKHQVHPDVVNYIREQNDPSLIDRIAAAAGDAWWSPPSTYRVSRRSGWDEVPGRP